MPCAAERIPRETGFRRSPQQDTYPAPRDGWRSAAKRGRHGGQSPRSRVCDRARRPHAGAMIDRLGAVTAIRKDR